MFWIDLDDIDELYNISLELGIITYLQGLVQIDKECNHMYEPSIDFASSCCEKYLLDEQLELVLKFRQTIEREDFFKKEHPKRKNAR